MVSEWAHRFYDNIDPSSNERGFDDLGNLEKKPINEAIIKNKRGKEKEKQRLKFRMDELKDRISRHAGIPATFPLPPSYLKNPQCSSDIWKKIAVSLVPTSNKTFKGLAVQRHSKVESTLDNINHIELSFSIKNDIDIGYGFWLIDDQCKDFVYAILKSSMFRAWCELTAADEGKEKGHFSTGMWDTFPLPKLTESQERKIITAGQDIQKGRPQSQEKLDKFVDRLFKPANSLTDKCRKRILAGEFLKMFSSLRMDIASLALRCPKP